MKATTYEQSQSGEIAMWSGFVDSWRIVNRIIDFGEGCVNIFYIVQSFSDKVTKL